MLSRNHVGWFGGSTTAVFADGGVGDGDGAARVRDGTGEDSAVL
jgi:hypothetical protein